MKFLRILSGAVFTILVFLAGVWLFAPWENGGLYALDKFRLAAAQKGCYINYSGFESSGAIQPVYRLRSLDIEGSISRATLSDVEVRVLPLSSLLSGAPTCQVEFKGGSGSIILMENVLNDIVKLNGGRFSVSASRGGLSVSRMNIDGEYVQVSGGIDYDRSSRTFTENSVTMTVSNDIDSIMGGMGEGYIGRYIERAEPGEWRIRDNAISGR
jgi:hypothetical protein